MPGAFVWGCLPLCIRVLIGCDQHLVDIPSGFTEPCAPSWAEMSLKLAPERK